MPEDEFKGIFITEGMKMSISNLSITLHEDGTTEIPPVTITTEIDMCPYWLDIALSHLQDCDAAHNDVLKHASADDDKHLGAAIKRECQSGMQAIMASYAALDAMYGSIRRRTDIPDDLVTTWREKGTPRYAQMSEVFRRAFKIQDKPFKNLRDGLKKVQQYRDWATHSPPGSNNPVTYDKIKIATDWKFVAFSYDNAYNITRFVLMVVGQACELEFDEQRKEIENYVKELKGRISSVVSKFEDIYGEQLLEQGGSEKNGSQPAD
jgi:hypothetical protein